MSTRQKLIVISVCLLAAFFTTTAVAGSFNFFECWPSALSSGPPYPTGPLKKNIYLETTSAGLQQTSIISAGIQRVDPAVLPLQMTSHNGGGGDFAVDSFFDVYYTGVVGDFPAESFFDVFVEIDLPDGDATLLRKEPTLFSGESFFDVFVEIDIDALAGTYQVLQLHVEADAPEPTSLTFNGRGIDLNEDEKVDTLESFFDVWFELSAENSALIDSHQPLVTITLTGQVITEPATLPGDVDDDGYVGGLDLTTIITNWGMNPATRLQGDLSGDGTVSGPDYTEVITYWGTGVPPEPPSGNHEHRHRGQQTFDERLWQQHTNSPRNSPELR